MFLEVFENKSILVFSVGIIKMLIWWIRFQILYTITHFENWTCFQLKEIN